MYVFGLGFGCWWLSEPLNPNWEEDGRLQEFLGISDGFGFTRKNELFVGRTAMLGFAAELIGTSHPAIALQNAYLLLPSWIGALPKSVRVVLGDTPSLADRIYIFVRRIF